MDCYDYHMSPEDKKTLNDNGPTILEALTIDEMFLAHLKRSRILTEERAEEINVLPTKYKKNGELLRILPTRGPTAFKNFIDALRATGHEHIAKALIHPKTIEQFFETNSKSEYATGNSCAARSVLVASPMQDSPQLNPSGNSGSARSTEDERDGNFGASNAVSLPDGPNDPEISIEAKPADIDISTMEGLKGMTLVKASEDRTVTISWKQGSFLGIGGDRHQQYVKCSYQLQNGETFPVYINAAWDKPARLQIDRNLRCGGINNRIRFFVLDDLNNTPYQHRFIQSDFERTLNQGNEWLKSRTQGFVDLAWTAGDPLRQF